MKTFGMFMLGLLALNVTALVDPTPMTDYEFIVFVVYWVIGSLYCLIANRSK